VSLAFAEKIKQGKFSCWQPGPGKKFRSYFKRADHNAAIDYFRQHPRREVAWEDMDRFSDPSTDQSPWGQVWSNEWRRAVVNGARERLRAFQQQHPGNCYFTVIRILEAHLLEGGAGPAADGAVRPGNHLPPVLAQGAAQALRQRPRVGRGPAPVSSR
jgi:hypothetical protein